MRNSHEELVIVIDQVPMRKRAGILKPIGPTEQGSKKHVGRGMMVDANPMLKHWRKLVSEKVAEVMVGQEAFLLQPVVADFTFYMRRPKSHFGARGLLPSAPKYPIRTPDVDKLARAIMDSITDGRAWDDDARAVDMNVRKRYESLEHPSGVVIRLRHKEDEDGP